MPLTTDVKLKLIVRYMTNLRREIGVAQDEDGEFILDGNGYNSSEGGNAVLAAFANISEIINS